MTKLKINKKELLSFKQEHLSKYYYLPIQKNYSSNISLYQKYNLSQIAKHFLNNCLQIPKKRLPEQTTINLQRSKHKKNSTAPAKYTT